MKKNFHHNVTKLDKYITQKVIMLRRDKNINVSKIAEILNVTDSFIKNIESYNNKYNLYHLFLIIEYFKGEISLSDFFPKEDNYKKVKGFETYSEFSKLIEDLKEELTSIVGGKNEK